MQGDNDALKLTLELGDLEPETGKKSVSDMQRYHEIAGADYLTLNEKLAAIGEYRGPR